MISLIHPSRGRPEKAVKTARKWIDLAGVDVEYILSIDESDHSKDQYINSFGFNRLEWPTRHGYCLSDNKSVVEATNKAAKVSSGDILLYLSDDFDCFQDWGVAIEKEVKDFPPMWLLKVDDCLQKFEVPVLTIPIMSRGLYERLGYFWYPGYKSMFVDVDLFYTCRKLGVIKNAQHLKFPHNHVSLGKAEDDETYRRSAANWKQGEDLFNQRKLQGFIL